VKLGTLHRHVRAHKLCQTLKFEHKANNALKQVFNMEVEQNLLEYIKQAARMHYGMSKMDVRKLAEHISLLKPESASLVLSSSLYKLNVLHILIT
jgi:hypothetical protein